MTTPSHLAIALLKSLFKGFCYALCAVLSIIAGAGWTIYYTLHAIGVLWVVVLAVAAVGAVVWIVWAIVTFIASSFF